MGYDQNDGYTDGHHSDVFEVIDIVRNWDEIAKHIGVHRETAQRWGRRRRLPFARLMGKTVLSTKRALDAYLKGEDYRLPPWCADPKSSIIFDFKPGIGKPSLGFDSLVVGWRAIGRLLGVNKVTVMRWFEQEGLPLSMSPGRPGGSGTPATTPRALQAWVETKIKERLDHTGDNDQKK